MASWPSAAVDSIHFEGYPDYDLHILFCEDEVGSESGSESEQSLALDTAASYEHLEAPAELSTVNNVLLEKRSWSDSTLPDEILDMIFTQVPLAPRCRCRCVCRAWKRILELPLLSDQKRITPPSPIMTSFGENKARFFCHFEEKWFRLPYPCWKTNLSWDLQGTDAGLLLYRYRWSSEKRFWLSVCNPLTRSTRVILANFKLPRRLKLLVDRENKTFKVIGATDKLALTSIYDSTTASWHFCSCFPPFWCKPLELFVWKNVIYGYEIHGGPFPRKNVARFNMESGKWTKVMDLEEYPCETGYQMDRFILSGKDQVMLIQFGYSRRTDIPYFSVWKLLDDGPNGSEVSFSMWEKVEIGSDMVMENLAERNLKCACYGAEYICLLFSGDRNTWRSRRCNVEHKCLKYSFVTEEWSVMPFPTGWRTGSRLHGWEPSVDINPGSDTFHVPFEQDIRLTRANSSNPLGTMPNSS